MRTIAGLLLATLLALGTGCAQKDWIDRTLVTVDVTGTWIGSFQGTGGTAPEVVFDLEQKGSAVKGSIRFTTGTSAFGHARAQSGPVVGTVAGDVLSFKQVDGSVDGEMTVSGDEMSGRASFLGSRPLSLRRVDAIAPPASPPR